MKRNISSNRRGVLGARRGAVGIGAGGGAAVYAQAGAAATTTVVHEASAVSGSVAATSANDGRSLRSLRRRSVERGRDLDRERYGLRLRLRRRGPRRHERARRRRRGLRVG